jgi:putative ABC transport system ATP-binding protein
MNEIAVIDPLVDRLRTLLGFPPHAGEDLLSRAVVSDPTPNGVEGSNEEGLDEEPPPERTAFEQLVDRLARGGLVLQPFEAPLDIALQGVRGGRPVLSVGRDGALCLLLERLGSRVRVEDEHGQREWLKPPQLAERLGLASVHSEHAWLAVDSPHALPLELHDDESPWRLAYDLVRADRADLLAIAVYASGVGLLSLVLPLTVQVLVNTVAFGTLVQPIVLLTLLLAVGLVFAAVLQATQAFMVEIIQRRLVVRVVSQLSERLRRVSADAFQAHRGSELMNRFFDVFVAQKAIASLALGGIEAVLAVVAGLVLLAVYHPVLLGFGGLIVAGLFVVLRVMGRGATRTAIRESRAKYAVAAWLEDMAVQRNLLKLGGGGDFAQRRLDGLAAAWLGAREAHFRIVFRQYLGTLGLQVLASASLLGLGGWLVVQRELSVGQLVAAELVVNLVVVSLSKLGGKLETAYDLVAAADKLHVLLDLPLEREGGSLPARARGAAKVELRHVSTPGAELRDVSLVIEAGQRVVVRGGAERTRALVELLFGLRAQASGVIRLDGDDLRDLSLRALRSRVLLVAQPEVLPTSVAENVAAVGRALTPRDVWGVLERVGLSERIERLPDGLGTVLGEGGAPLTRDEVQRLVIARALAARPGLLVLDGSLDGLSRPAQQAVLAAVERDVTLLVVTRTDELDTHMDAHIELPEEGS